MVGIMEKKMETTVVYWGYIGIGLEFIITLGDQQFTARL